MAKGFGSERQTISIKRRKAYRDFLDKVLQVTAQGSYNKQLVYSLLEVNLEKLNDNFAEVLHDWAASSLPTLAQSQAETKAKAIAIFSYLIREFNLGSKESNLEIAITGYQSALQIYTRTAYQEEWANIQYNLGTFYRERHRGIRAENLDLAIKYFQNALQVFTRITFREQWAIAQHNLGTTYSERVYGDKADNLEKALTCFENALLVRTHDNCPEKFGAIKNDMAGAYASRIRGERTENIEKAIACCQEALRVCPRDSLPEKWAGIQNNLGAAYFERILGDRVENIELAIACFENTLQVYTPESFPFPENWAAIQISLGRAYYDRIPGERVENLEKAIACFERALQVYTIETFPEQWGVAQAALGEAYYHRILGERAENLEQAIACYKNTLQVYTREAFPQAWEAAQNELGSAYFDRIRGDRVENLEKAIAYFENALQVCTREANPESWAGTQNNLGNAYCNRIQGDRAKNLEQAIAYLENALKVYTHETFPENWARVQGNLGTAYRSRIQGNPSENLEQAIAYYHKALQVYTQEAFPQDWARIQHNLGNAYNKCFEENEVENLELAIIHYQKALQIRTCEFSTQQWANTQNSLAGVYFKRIKGDKSENLKLAIAAFKGALRVYSPNAFPQECYITSRNLGIAAFTVRLWAEAIEGYAVAIEAAETSRSWTTSESRRQEILAEAIDVYQNMVQACINNGQLDKAIETVERSRSKRLVDLMASNDLYQGGEISLEVKELLQQFEDLQQRIDQERSQDGSENNRGLMELGSRTSDRASFQAHNEAIATLEAQKQQIWNQIRSEDLVLAGEIQVNAPNFSAMQKLIDQPTTAILSFYTTSNETHIFVLRQNQITLHTCTGQGLETLQAWIFQNWLKPYVEDTNTWQSKISSFLEELAQRLQISSLIAQHLEGITELILVSHLVLHQIPLAALPIGNAQYLGDKFLIRYTPSCQILEFCQQRDEVKAHLTYGIVEDATDDLPCASFEGEQIAQLHQISNNRRLRGSSQATRDNYRQLAKQVQVLHSCHHAESCLDNPLNSQLKLGDGSITLGQLMTPAWRLPKLSDVFLSCCETGLGLPEITDDILTLSTGFLCAGARSVVSTLWSVDDLATTLFSLFYYQHRKQGQSRPKALQQAQIKLRQLSKEEFLSTEDIKELYEQAKIRKEEADKKRKQYQRGSAECVQWTREYLKYRKIQTQISTIENSLDGFPFSHPRYWAAFTCQGLR